MRSLALVLLSLLAGCEAPPSGPSEATVRVLRGATLIDGTWAKRKPTHDEIAEKIESEEGHIPQVLLCLWNISDC